MAGKKRGPAPKITPEIEDRLMQLLQAGATKRDACDACGISDQTLLNHEKKSLEFLERLRKAQGQAACEKALVISKAAREGSWQAALAWLERRRHDEWGRKDRMEQSGPGGGPIQLQHSGQVDIKQLTDDELRALDQVYDQALARASQNGAGTKEPA